MQSAGTGSGLLDLHLEYTTMTQTSRQKQRRSAMEENAVRADATNPLGILSAERYNDGTTLSIARSLTEMAQQQPRDMSAGYLFGFEEVRAVPRSPTGEGVREVEGRRNEVDNGARVKGGKGGNRKKEEEEEGSTERRRKKKKQKTSEDEEADDEATKKARGRPRLDTKDETAADRRRTQIRMAQRAYRHRKETTISSLEKQVEKLQSTTEEMNNIFISLHDFAVSKGLLQREPEFGQHLQSATQRFLALAKSCAEDEHHDDSNHPEENKLGNSDMDLETVRQQQQQPPTPEDEAANTQTVSIWGYEIPKPSPIPYTSQQPWYDQASMPHPRANRHQHQIISRATPENASFSFDMNDYTGTNSNIQTWRAQLPPQEPSYQFALGNLHNLAPPESFGHYETNFARRLQRTAIERGFRLITHPNPNPKQYNRAFGLSLKFHTKEAIVARLKRFVSQNSTKDSLNNWNVPFVHLGGSGTYYPLAEDERDELMPKHGAGRSMGPFDPMVMAGKEKYMLDDFRTNVPGFDGEFFDANDVEGYLRGRGIDIPAEAEFVTVDLDKVNLQEVAPVPTPISLATQASNEMSASPRTPATPDIGPLSKVPDASSSSSFDEFMRGLDGMEMNPSTGFLNASTPSFPAGFTDWMSTSNPALGGSKASGEISMNAFNFTAETLETASNSQGQLQRFDWDSSASEKSRVVTLSVSVLVEYIIRRGVCLGRAPGFRPQDVDLAIRRTIQEAF